MNDSQIVIAIITGVVTAFGGGFALVKYKINNDNKTNTKREEMLFEYLGVKNGHTERIAKEFAITMREIQKSTDENMKQLQRSIDANTSVMQLVIKPILKKKKK